ncbi:MAG: hypothetical protein KTR31_28320 [Myxococcales bacterium]|nr:hypothetical protein [Myxococcales bacterium]
MISWTLVVCASALAQSITHRVPLQLLRGGASTTSWALSDTELLLEYEAADSRTHLALLRGGTRAWDVPSALPDWVWKPKLVLLPWPGVKMTLGPTGRVLRGSSSYLLSRSARGEVLYGRSHAAGLDIQRIGPDGSSELLPIPVDDGERDWHAVLTSDNDEHIAVVTTWHRSDAVHVRFLDAEFATVRSLELQLPFRGRDLRVDGLRRMFLDDHGDLYLIRYRKGSSLEVQRHAVDGSVGALPLPSERWASYMSVMPRSPGVIDIVAQHDAGRASTEIVYWRADFGREQVTVADRRRLTDLVDGAGDPRLQEIVGAYPTSTGGAVVVTQSYKQVERTTSGSARTTGAARQITTSKHKLGDMLLIGFDDAALPIWHRVIEMRSDEVAFGPKALARGIDLHEDRLRILYVDQRQRPAARFAVVDALSGRLVLDNEVPIDLSSFGIVRGNTVYLGPETLTLLVQGRRQERELWWVQLPD